MKTYQQVHRHLDKTRGLASSHLCRCGAQAKDWAYQHNAVEELREGDAVYSASPDDYEPMCRVCHNKLDGHSTRNIAKADAVQRTNPEYQERKAATGMANAQARDRRAASDPGFRERLRAASLRGARTVASVRRKCSGCDMVSHPVGIGKHQKSSGHTGWVVVP